MTDLAPFDEDRPEYKGFNSFYEKAIELRLIALDSERRKRVANMWKIVGLGLPVVAAMAFFMVRVMDWGGFAMFAGFAGVFMVAGLAFWQIGKAAEQTKELIMGQITKFLGWTFQAKNFENLPIDLYRKYDLLPSYSRMSSEDMIRGQGHGADFVLHELHLERRQKSKNSDNYVTVFRGILMELKFPRKFEGITLLLRDKGWFNSKKKQDLKRVGLEDPHFEKIFEAYGSDQVTARVLLDPLMIQALVDLEQAFGGSKVRALFIDGSMFIAFEAKNQFEAGSMFTPLQDRARVRTILTEIGEIFDLIDGVVNTHRAV